MVLEERSERYDLGGEAEAVLSLLTEDIGEECFRVRKEARRLAKKPTLEKREDGEVSNKCPNEKKRVDLGVLESELRCEYESVNSERKRREGNFVENRKRKGPRETRERIYAKKGELEGEFKDRREGRFVEKRGAQTEDEERSSCSSYYSLSSTGDYDSDNEIELSEGRFLGESSSYHKGNSSSNVYREAREEDRKRDYREHKGASLTTMSAKKELYSGSSVAESDFRKKSEKKLVDVVEGKIESKQETSQKESKFPMAHESDFGRSSDYYVSYDDRKEKSTGNTEIDEERKNQLLQRGDEVSRQSETRLKYKHFEESQDIRSEDVRRSYGSQQKYSGKSEMSAKVGSSSQEIVEEHQAAVGIAPEKMNIRGILVRYETSVKEEAYSTNILSSINNAAKQQQQYDQASGLVESRGKSQQLTKQDGELSLGSKVGSANEVSEGSQQFGTTALHGGAKSNSSHGQSSEFTLHEDMIGSAVRLEKSSSHYVGEFVDQEPEPRHDIQQSGTEGPSDEMWNVDESSAPELSKAEVQDDTSKAGNAIIKRTGRSLWNIIGDIVRLRWASHSESHSSGRKTGGRSSPNQSTSSETWFSGHEAEDNEEVTGEKEKRSITQGLYGSHQEDKILSQVEEGSSSSTSEGHLKQVGTDAPSSSVVPGSYTPPISISLPSEGKSRAASSAAPVDSISSPALRLQRSPIVRAVSETGEANASNSSMSQQLNTGSVEQPESVVNEGEVKRRKLQRNNQVVKDRFDEWEEAYRLEAEQRKIDEMFMREALLEAQKAADNWEVPVGAVLVHKGKIVARGCNLVEELRDSTAHAEMICIREGSNMLRTWRLSETTLYVTLEPCPMCAGAILQARIDTVVWGAPNKLLGADGSWIRLFPSGDGGNDLEQTDKPAAPVHPFHPKIIIRRVLAAECADAMQQFFKLRRKKDKKPEAPSSPPTCLPISHRPSKFLAKMHDAFHLMFCL
ncbi:UNVERIFIED_CONTAM: tRNA(adenine(34)) deaminase, chloroplastic [Sesamum angustifolium]|uniref:tRNA(adenine(34)) deaminase n=1 Tax=Sesamum angustifolium TaxID=2727405 RepID=A0AAW2M799_9LAMI